MIAFKKGNMARFPSITVRISLSAVTRREKLIHMGMIKSIRMTDLDLSRLFARI